MASEADVRALVITGFGLNCEAETAHAFAMAGARCTQVHLNDLLTGDGPSLDAFHVLAFIGGFSFGDHLGAGAVFANRVRCRMWEPLRRFVDDGRLVIGICNGFQTLTRLGLLPHRPADPYAREVSLTWNERGVFHDAWVTLTVDPDSPSVFLRGIDRIELPVRHGEGRLVCAGDAVRQTLEDQHLVAMRYADPATGEPTADYPHNPNGSDLQAAALSDPSGRILGLMPHPEAFLHPYNHPRWTRRRLDGPLPEHGEGLRLFHNAVRFAAAEIV
jgi:phosphoribosylformylglycinamidine synthase subunit PurQ / glutaminase